MNPGTCYMVLACVLYWYNLFHVERTTILIADERASSLTVSGDRWLFLLPTTYPLLSSHILLLNAYDRLGSWHQE